MRYDLTALLGVFAVMWVFSLGCGLTVERLLGLRLHNALVPVLGLCAAMVLIMPGYALGLSDALAIPLLVAVAFLGLVLSRRELVARLNPGWAGVAGVAVYVLYMLPVIAYGRWTWSGYNFVNDTAFEMLLADHVRGFGTVLGSVPQSTEREFLRSYIGTGYPLGTQALLGTFAAILRAPSAVLYQGYISGLAAIGTVALARLVTGLLTARRAALVAATAMAANLTYQYALQGGIKEIGLLVTLCATGALGAEMLERHGQPFRAAALIAVGAAASLAAYNAVALPFLGAMLLFAALGWLVKHRSSIGAAPLAPAVFGIGLTALLSIPALGSLKTFFTAAQTGQGASGVGASQFGQLLRPLPLSQLSGVWLSGEYRTPVLPQPAATLTVIATVAILLAVLPTVLWALRRGRLGLPVLLATMALVLLVVYPRVSPYARGKLLAIAGPVVLLVALVGLSGVGGRIGKPGLAVAAALAAAVIASDLLAYSHDRVAPTARIEAISAVGERFAGRGPMLWNEFEEYAKYFARAARIDNPFEALTPLQAQLLDASLFYGHYYDLDEEQLSFVERWSLIVTRRSPAASRPPANYEEVYANRYYVVWRRRSAPRVLEHLPLQRTYSSMAVVPCQRLRALVRRAPAGARLTAAIASELGWFEPLYSDDRSFGWGIDPEQPGAVVTNTAGHAEGVISVSQAGFYRLWVQGDFPAPLHVEIDGRQAGVVSESDTPHQWSSVAIVRLGAGQHVLRALRPGGRRHLGPGQFASGLLGAIALQRPGRERLVSVPLASWHRLCGTEADWVEVTE